MVNLIRQTYNDIRQHPVMAWVSVIGTSLSIFLIMVVVMLQQVKTAPFAPESRRDRFLISGCASIYKDLEGDNYAESNGCNSYEYFTKQFKSLTLPERVTATTSEVETGNIALKGRKGTVRTDLLQTDAEFWKVFDFTFIDGHPYDEAAFEEGRPEIVICESVARKLFGSPEGVSGREIDLNYAPYRISGVVKDVSTLATHSYAQAWIPFSSTGMREFTWDEIGMMGSLRVIILAKSEDDFDGIREEYNRRLEEINSELSPTGWKMLSRNRPYTQEKDAAGFSSNNEPDMEHVRRTQFFIYLILLLVPAVNLSSMTESRMRQRVAEIGVRRAFGATRGSIILQIVSENLLLTLAAGLAGWILSVGFAFAAGSLLFSQPYSSTFNPPSLNTGMLVRWSTFFMALLFCFILNLLSCGIPAWKASRTAIVSSLSRNSR